MRKLHAIIAVMVAALLTPGCGTLPINIPAILASPTPIPSQTPALPTPTAAPVATETPTVSTPTPVPSTFTAIPTFTQTSVAAGTATTTPIVTGGPAGAAIGYGNVTLVLPAGLGSDTVNTTTNDVEFPFQNPSNGEMPQHIKLVIGGYPLQGTLLQPQIMIFPAAKYASYTDFTRQIITALQSMQYYDGQPLPQGFPDGPFNAHVGSVQFAKGHGIRYLTQFDQAVLPINNHELIYYFHGLTADGSSYVEAVLPVQAPFLQADENPASRLPPGGIPFILDNLGTYFQDIANKLNATPPDGFTPSLSTLDAFIGSITVSAAP